MSKTVIIKLQNGRSPSESHGSKFYIVTFKINAVDTVIIRKMQVRKLYPSGPWERYMYMYLLTRVSNLDLILILILILIWCNFRCAGCKRK